MIDGLGRVRVRVRMRVWRNGLKKMSFDSLAGPLSGSACTAQCAYLTRARLDLVLVGSYEVQAFVDLG